VATVYKSITATEDGYLRIVIKLSLQQGDMLAPSLL